MTFVTGLSCAGQLACDSRVVILGGSGDLVSRLSNGPCGASYGLLWGLVGDTKWTYEVN